MKILSTWLTVLAITLSSLAASAPANSASADDNVHDAFLFAYPVYQFARTRAEAVASAEAAGRSVVNQFGHRKILADHTHRAVTTPNNDTLYSSAWLDLSGGPVVIDMPALPNRYHSVALMDVFTDHFAVLETRAQRGMGGRFLVTGPKWRGRIPAGMSRIASPTNDVWALVRIFVNGQEDLPDAVAAQAKFKAAPLIPDQRVARQSTTPPRAPDSATFVQLANEFLSRGPMPPQRTRSALRLTHFGIAPGRNDAWNGMSESVRALWRRNFKRHESALRAGFAAQGVIVNGWSYPRAGMGRFGSNDAYRAAVALGGLAALPEEEAVYLTSVSDATGQALQGDRCYRLRLPKNVPADAFWSLSIYEIAPDGRLFFTDNPLRRYAINGATPGMTRNDDGSLDIIIQSAAARGNWLPAPRGPFRLTFRAYLPQRPLLSGRWRLSGLVPCIAPTDLSGPSG